MSQGIWTRGVLNSVIVGAASFFVVACGSDTTSNGGPAGDGGAAGLGGQGGSGGTDDAAAAGGSGGGAGGGQQTEERSPNVFVLVSQGTDNSHVMFWNALVNIERASCSFRLMGPCEQKVKCGPPQAYLTAGTVRINGGKAPLVFSDDGVGLYDVQQGAGALLFDGGETLTVTADGSPVAGADDIPKFNEALQAPPLAVVNSPSFEDFPPIDAPISLAWSPFQGGKVYLEIVPKGDIATVIQCRVPSEAGTFTLPPEVMEQFSPGPGNCVSVASAGDKRFQAGKFGVEFLALYVATRPDGKNASVCSK